jgi:hypothetical protein
MNWKRFGRKRSWPHFKVLFRNSRGGTEKNHERTQSGQPFSGLRFEPRASQIRIRGVNRATMTSGRAAYLSP